MTAHDEYIEALTRWRHGNPVLVLELLEARKRCLIEELVDASPAGFQAIQGAIREYQSLIAALTADSIPERINAY